MKMSSALGTRRSRAIGPSTHASRCPGYRNTTTSGRRHVARCHDARTRPSTTLPSVRGAGEGDGDAPGLEQPPAARAPLLGRFALRAAPGEHAPGEHVSAPLQDVAEARAVAAEAHDFEACVLQPRAEGIAFVAPVV